TGTTGGQAEAASRLGRARLRPRAGRAADARARARADRPRRSRVRGGRGRGDAHAHPARRRRLAENDARLHQPDRIDDRDRPADAAERETLAGRRNGPALDSRRHARSRASVPPRNRLPETAEAAPHAPTRDESGRGGDYRSGSLNLKGPPPKFHGERDILAPALG